MAETPPRNLPLDLSKLVKQLRRNIIAQSAFQEALAGCYHLMQVGLEFDAYPVIATGVSVTYARPFMDANGLGRLDPKKYAVFPGKPEIAHTHRDLIEGRNSIDAHYSPMEAAKFFQDPVEQQRQLQIRMPREGGVWLVQPPLAVWDHARLDRVERLIKYQFDRLQTEAGVLTTLLEQDKEWPDGEYYLGETFP